MATDVVVPCSTPTRKVARLNPARRKAAKAKEAGDSLQSVKAACSMIPNVDSRSQCAKSSLSKASVIPPAVSGRGGIQKIADYQKQAQSRHVLRSQPKEREQHLSGTTTSTDPAVVMGGLIGCVAGAVILLGAGLCSRVAGVDSAILTARTSKVVVTNLTEETVVSLKAGTSNPPEALDMLRRTSLAYATALPGGTAFVEQLFRELDLVRRQYGVTLDQALTEACDEVAKARGGEISSNEMHATMLKQLARLSACAGNAAQDIVSRNPGLRPYIPALRKQKVPIFKLNMIVRNKS